MILYWEVIYDTNIKKSLKKKLKTFLVGPSGHSRKTSINYANNLPTLSYNLLNLNTILILISICTDVYLVFDKLTWNVKDYV